MNQSDDKNLKFFARANNRRPGMGWRIKPSSKTYYKIGVEICLFFSLIFGTCDYRDQGFRSFEFYNTNITRKLKI